MAPTTDLINSLLLTQKDWPLWFQFICWEANFAKIWDYVDLDKVENEIKENTEPAIPLITVVLVAFAAPAVAPAMPTIISAILVTAPAVPVAAFTAPAATLTFTGIVIPALLN